MRGTVRAKQSTAAWPTKHLAMKLHSLSLRGPPALQGRRSAWKGLYSLSNYDDDPRLVRDQMLFNAALAAMWSLSILTQAVLLYTDQ